MTERPLRFVLATPICDGHDVAVCAITRIVRAEGVEAVYIGFNKSPQQIVKAAVEEDADAIAVSTYNGGHMLFLRDVVKEMERQGIAGMPLFAGGGGTILASEVGPLERGGVTKVYRPPMDLMEACRDMIRRAGELRGARAKAAKAAGGAKSAKSLGSAKSAASAKPPASAKSASALSTPQARIELARALTRAEWSAAPVAASAAPKPGKVSKGAMALAMAPAKVGGVFTQSHKDTKSDPSELPPARVWGINGRGGAGKSTILDELIFRFLRATDGELAIVSVDPTMGDRLRMLYCYSPRVFLRSVGLGPGETLDAKLPPILAELRARGFSLILVESVGLGQNELGVAPFVDASIYCMTPEYGTNVQLEKEALLTRADVVVMNKRDYPQADVKGRRVRAFLHGAAFIMTEAKSHGDPGVNELFATVAERAGLATRGLPVEPTPRGALTDELARSHYLGEIVRNHEGYYAELEREIKAAEKDPARAREHRKQFNELWARHGYDGDRTGLVEVCGALVRPEPAGHAGQAGKAAASNGSKAALNGNANANASGNGANASPGVPVARRTTCGLWTPVTALPPRESGLREIITYLRKQNAPGQFPYTEGAFAQRRTDEDPIRMFAGLGLPETTNARFHLLARGHASPRLSTAFDSLTLYGWDSDEPGALAKIGEGGVAVDTVEDMIRLYDGFDLERGSVSLTMSGPAPTVLALFFAAAKRRGFDLRKLRGTIQTDILKEIQAQNEAIFPLDPSLRLIGDMFAYCEGEAPLWYPISISGYHIHEAGANPIQELAFTLANGFTYVELMRRRGMDPEEFCKRLTFFFTAGSELEFHALGRVARRVWSVAMDRIYGVKGAGRRLKFHTQTSGRSLQDVEPLHNLARVALQAERALHNNTNSLHTNSYKETYSTPEEDDVILAMGCQQIPLRESGDFKYTENLNQGAYGLSFLEDELERAVWAIFREIDQQGGVIPAIENEYFRTVIQEEVMRDQAMRKTGEKLIVGVNFMSFSHDERPRGALVQIPLAEKKKQIARTRAFKEANGPEAAAALDRLQRVARGDGNVFAELMNAAEVATIGQVTHALWEVWGRFRPSM